MFSSGGSPFHLIEERLSAAPVRDHFHPQSQEINNYVHFIENFAVAAYKGFQGEFIITWGDDDEHDAAPPPDALDLEDQLVAFFNPYDIPDGNVYDIF